MNIHKLRYSAYCAPNGIHACLSFPNLNAVITQFDALAMFKTNEWNGKCGRKTIIQFKFRWMEIMDTRTSCMHRSSGIQWLRTSNSKSIACPCVCVCPFSQLSAWVTWPQFNFESFDCHSKSSIRSQTQMEKRKLFVAFECFARQVKMVNGKYSSKKIPAKFWLIASYTADALKLCNLLLEARAASGFNFIQFSHSR